MVVRPLFPQGPTNQACRWGPPGYPTWFTPIYVLINPTSHGVSDSLAPMWGGLGPQRPLLEIKEGVISDPMMLKSITGYIWGSHGKNQPETLKEQDFRISNLNEMEISHALTNKKFTQLALF